MSRLRTRISRLQVTSIDHFSISLRNYYFGQGRPTFQLSVDHGRFTRTDLPQVGLCQTVFVELCWNLPIRKDLVLIAKKRAHTYYAIEHPDPMSPSHLPNDPDTRLTYPLRNPLPKQRKWELSSCTVGEARVAAVA